MKKIFLILFAVSFIGTSCTQYEEPTTGKGSITLSTRKNTDIDLVTRANDTITDFTGYTLTLDGADYTVMPCPTNGKVSNLTSGNYTITLSNLPTDFSPAFNDSRYAGSQTVTVTQGTNSPVSLVLTQANAGIKFAYDASLTGAGLTNLVATVSQKDEALTYSRENRKKTGYFLPGEVVLTLECDGSVITIGGQSNKKYTLAAKELWTITLKVIPGAIGMTIAAEIDVATTEREEELEVDSDTGHAAKSILTIAGFENKDATVAFTDGTSAKITFSTDGRATISGTKSQVIQSIQPDGGTTILIGRTVGEAFTLKTENGEIVFRDADGQGRIPLGTRAEMDLLNNTKVTAKLSGSYIQEGNIDLLFQEGDNILTSPYYWYGIGVSKSYYFTGTYDGGGYTLSHIGSRGNGLFGFAKNATIKNITLSSGSIEGTDYVGGICGWAEGTTQILNCTNKAQVSGARCTAGIVGEIDSASKTAKVSGCTNYGSISGSYGAAGICGSGSGIIENSVNHGSVSGGQWIGGIVSNSSATVTACANHGSISAFVGECAGGICGRGFNIVITACYNTGTVTGVKNVGGITGYFYKSSTGTAARLSACYSTGLVTGTTHVGGVCGEQGDNGIFENCYWLPVTGGITTGVGNTESAQVLAFNNENWPLSSDTNWGHSYWQSVGSHNQGTNSIFPTLFWE